MEGLPIDVNPWVLPPLVSCVTLLGLGAFGLATGRARKVNLLFAGICFLGTILSIEKTLASVLTDPGLALRLSRMDHAVVVFFIPFYLHFTYAFAGVVERRWLLPLAYGFSAGMSLLSQGESYLIGVTRYEFGYFATGGPWIYLFGAVSSVNTLYCLWVLVHRLRNEKNPDRRNKTKYIMFGLGGAALMAHFNFLPLVGIPFYPLGNFAFIPLLGLGYAVLRHDLLDIGVMVKQGLVYSLLTGLLTAAYAIMIVCFNRASAGIGRQWSTVLSFCLFVLIVFVMDPLKKKIQGALDRRLARGRYDYQKTLASLSEAMASMLNLDEIMDRTLGAFTDAMGLHWAYVMLRQEGGGCFQIHSLKGPCPISRAVTLNCESPLVMEMGRTQRQIGRSDLEQRSFLYVEGAAVREDFKKLGAAVLIPMVFKGQVNGLFAVAHKRSGDLFTAGDFELLRTLANNSAVAIENAKAYRVIERLNENLETMVEDRTEKLRKAMEEKEKAQDLLIRSESLAAVGGLVAGVAHELNNPIASVSSLVQSALETLEDPDLGGRDRDEAKDEVADDLNFSLKELMRAKGIVNSLLGLSRQTNEYSEPVALNDLCHDALRILHNRFKHTGIRIIEELGHDLPGIRGNFANLGQVCLNIITNALQAVDALNGKISIRTRCVEGGRKVIFECEDNGPGIPKKERQNIFKPFYTTKEVGAGTGLGLYISHEIVRRHDGHILVDSNAHGGAIFRVELPVLPPRLSRGCLLRRHSDGGDEAAGIGFPGAGDIVRGSVID